MDRFARLTDLARANAGRRRLPALLRQLSRQLGHEITPVDVLPLERADALWSIIDPVSAHCVREQRPPAFSAWSPDAMTAVAPRLASFVRAVGSPTLLFLLPRSLGVGPVRVAASAIAPQVRPLAEGDREECVLVTEDGRAGLALHYHASDHEPREPAPYELLIWGEPWGAAAVSHLPFELAANAA